MWFLYFLLIIIAIGVLLMSSEGKKLLAFLMSMGFWGISFIIGFGIVALVIAFFYKTELGRNIFYILCFLVIIGILGIISEKVSNKIEAKLGKNNIILRNKKKIIIWFWSLWALCGIAICLQVYATGELLELGAILFTLALFGFPVIGLILMFLFGLGKSAESKK